MNNSKRMEIVSKTAQEISNIHECGADKVMNSVWENILINFAVEVLADMQESKIIKFLPEDKLLEGKERDKYIDQKWGDVAAENDKDFEMMKELSK